MHHREDYYSIKKWSPRDLIAQYYEGVLELDLSAPKDLKNGRILETLIRIFAWQKEMRDGIEMLSQIEMLVDKNG